VSGSVGIVNACTARYLRLRLDGQRLQLLGIDSGRLAEPRDVEEILLVPGNRTDLLVTTMQGTSPLWRSTTRAQARSRPWPKSLRRASPGFSPVLIR
jgi:FtsP/CotA-like multicopper oxidase with cupredoxin domain